MAFRDHRIDAFHYDPGACVICLAPRLCLRTSVCLHFCQVVQMLFKEPPYHGILHPVEVVVHSDGVVSAADFYLS